MKKILWIGLLTLSLFALAACGAAAPAAPAAEMPADTSEDMTEADDSQFGEAPMLAALVAAGELPPVEERLPKDYVTIPVVNEIGQYGGTWRTAAWDPGLGNIQMIAYDPPVRWKADYTGYEPGLFKDWAFNADGTEVTYTLREGLRWSDGAPFTTDDLRFWWEDLATNDDYGVVNVPWYGFKSTGDPMDVEFVDDYTMKWTWDEPHWITPTVMAQGFWESEPLYKPRHYLEQFHPGKSETGDWEQFELLSDWLENPAHPTVLAWQTERFTPGERTVLVRNPYYWKVDPAGNQLPYIDRMDIELVEDEEIRLLNLAQGKYDASFRDGSYNPLHIPFLQQEAEDGGYELYLGWVNGAGGWPCWLINQDYVGDGDDAEKDAEIRQLLRSIDWRKGVSVAIDRDRLIDVVWDGIGIAQQSTISPQAWHFESAEGRAVFEAWAAADAEYDPALAQTRFDTAGFVDADGDGWRDLPSGKPFQLILDSGDWGGKTVSENSNIELARQLREVGIDTLVNDLFGQPEWGLRQSEGLYMFRNCHASELDIWTYPDWIFPTRDNRAWPLQGKWNQTGGAEGEEPFEGSPAKRLIDLYNQGIAEGDPQRRHEIVWEAIQIHIDEGPFTLGGAGDQPMPVVIKHHFHNVPEFGILGPWAPGSPGNLYPEQFYMTEE